MVRGRPVRIGYVISGFGPDFCFARSVVQKCALRSSLDRTVQYQNPWWPLVTLTNHRMYFFEIR